ncbi:MAG: RpoL/Rpb11 RNA polymerase subunit family protein [Desulfurococcales archaeon]|jgi:DNA-directed RNA polymerase subunit L|nr:RpoL/Rpb11 RNA polymerase subunit family protein [Desulfurococcales archaeon]
MPIEILPKIRIEKKNDRELIFTLTGDQHGIPNLISKLAIKKPYISYASYIVDHPLTSLPKVVIVTDGTKDPLDALLEILEEAKQYALAMKKEIEEKL